MKSLVCNSVTMLCLVIILIIIVWNDLKVINFNACEIPNWWYYDRGLKKYFAISVKQV